MKIIIGTLAYLTAIAVVLISTLFADVAWPVTTVAVMMLVLGALWAWSDPAAPGSVPCDCPNCDRPKRATADDVR